MEQDEIFFVDFALLFRKFWQKNTEKCFTKAHVQIQALLKEEKFHPKRVTYISLAPSHSIVNRIIRSKTYKTTQNTTEVHRFYLHGNVSFNVHYG